MDAIKLYLRAIKDIPLLTPEGEKSLARKIRRGNTHSRRKMIQSNLRLVINIAKRYAKLGVPMMDLIEEGNIGLIKAVKKYNPYKGYRYWHVDGFPLFLKHSLWLPNSRSYCSKAFPVSLTRRTVSSLPD